MKQLKADPTLDDCVEKLFRRLQRINPRKNAADAKAAIRSAFAHLPGSFAFRDDDHGVPRFARCGIGQAHPPWEETGDDQ